MKPAGSLRIHPKKRHVPIYIYVAKAPSAMDKATMPKFCGNVRYGVLLMPNFLRLNPNTPSYLKPPKTSKLVRLSTEVKVPVATAPLIFNL